MQSNRYLLLVFAAAVYLVGTTEFMLSATLTPLAEVFSVTSAQASWLISAYALTYAVSAPVLGYFSDRVERRKLLLVAMFLFAIDSLAIIASPNFTIALLFRICGGLASAAIVPTIFSLIADIFPSRQQSSAMGTAMIGMTVGIVTGPVLAGVLTEYLTWYAPFIMTTLGSLIVWFCACKILPSSKQIHTLKTQGSFQWLRNTKITHFIGAKALWNGTAVSIFLLSGEILRHKFAIDSALIGLVISAFGAGLFIGNLLVGKLNNLLLNDSQRLLLVISIMAIAVATFIFAYFPLIAHTLCLVIWGSFLGMAAPLSTTIIATRSGENKGQVLAVSESLNNIVLFSMLPLLSWLLMNYGILTMGAMSTLVLVISIMICGFDAKRPEA
ncbi:MFS transporter [Providencia stuartii]|uniref:MFS transporter n=1 Tax=Providencia stuartii TaxID=588 RepID=UPI001FF676EE|nr:MFS transporter [Providencia stuartii]ELZ5939185.1 MFS transporter [Providencia stuartii]MCK1144455.1 MFS transporter [Providencia stuartii]